MEHSSRVGTYFLKMVFFSARGSSSGLNAGTNLVVVLLEAALVNEIQESNWFLFRLRQFYEMEKELWCLFQMNREFYWTGPT